jgi:ABC-type amino acid transport substrate-binding protein
MLEADPLNPDSFSLEAVQQRIAQGEVLSVDEYRRVIEALRSGRATAAAASKSRKAKPPVADLNAELDQLFAGL